MQEKERRQYRRLIYRKTFHCLGLMLVLSLLVGALLGGGIYMTHALCAFGFLMLCLAWFTYLKMTGMRPFGQKKPARKVPFFHRRFKDQKPNRPSFRMDSADFDDDLTAHTMASDENFTEKQVDTANAIAKAICGILMVLFSFLPLS